MLLSRLRLTDRVAKLQMFALSVAVIIGRAIIVVVAFHVVTHAISILAIIVRASIVVVTFNFLIHAISGVAIIIRASIVVITFHFGIHAISVLAIIIRTSIVVVTINPETSVDTIRNGIIVAFSVFAIIFRANIVVVATNPETTIIARIRARRAVTPGVEVVTHSVGRVSARTRSTIIAIGARQ
jgi:hypothetical protein